MLLDNRREGRCHTGRSLLPVSGRAVLRRVSGIILHCVDIYENDPSMIVGSRSHNLFFSLLFSTPSGGIRSRHSFTSITRADYKPMYCKIDEGDTSPEF